MHNHQKCQHELKFCENCDAVYCETCKSEWKKNSATLLGSGTTHYYKDPCWEATQGTCPIPNAVYCTTPTGMSLVNNK